MQKRLWKSLIVVTVLVGLFILAAGCQEETMDVKKTRLIAAENADIQKELTARNQEITKLKQQHAKELEQQKKLLSDCRQQNETLEKELKGGLEERINEVTMNIMNENAKLRDELEALKKQSEQPQEQTKAKAKPIEPR